MVGRWMEIIWRFGDLYQVIMQAGRGITHETWQKTILRA